MIKNRAPALVVDLEGVAAPVRDRVILFRLVTVLAGQLRARMDGRLRAAGVTSQQAAVLALASAAPPPTQGEVARLLGVTHQNVRQIMNALLRKGLLEVYTDAGDRRANRLMSTRRVARLFARRNAGDFAAVAGWFSALDDREVASLVDQLGRVLAALSSGSEAEGTAADTRRRAPRETSRHRSRARRRRASVT
jgi:DNA-binding MarR family transcriptional regulator